MKELGVARAEEAGLVFAFRARTVATLAVAAAISVLAAWPRSLVYVCFAGAFFVLGYIPFALRQHPWAEAIKLSFVVLDVLLITAAVMNVPATMVWIDWPIQTRLRSQNFLLLLLLLGEAALTYSPRRVLWTGAWVMGVWSLAFAVLYSLRIPCATATSSRKGPTRVCSRCFSALPTSACRNGWCRPSPLSS